MTSGARRSSDRGWRRRGMRRCGTGRGTCRRRGRRAPWRSGSRRRRELFPVHHGAGDRTDEQPGGAGDPIRGDRPPDHAGDAGRPRRPLVRADLDGDGDLRPTRAMRCLNIWRRRCRRGSPGMRPRRCCRERPEARRTIRAAKTSGARPERAGKSEGHASPRAPPPAARGDPAPWKWPREDCRRCGRRRAIGQCPAMPGPIVRYTIDYTVNGYD